MTEFKLIYWPMAGRGEYIRLMLVLAGKDWQEVNDPTEVVKLTKGGQTPGFPAYAPPVLVHNGSLTISQTPSIQEYLAGLFGMLPESAAEVAVARSLNLTMHDFILEGNLNYHMKDFHADYLDQKEYTEPFIKEFCDKRLFLFFDYFDRALKQNEGEYMFAGLTYVDVTLYHLMCVVKSDQFCDWTKITQKFPKLCQHWQRMDANEKIKQYKISEKMKYKLQGYSFM